MKKVQNYDHVHLVDFLHIESLEAGPEFVSLPLQEFLANPKRVLRKTMYRDDPENLKDGEIQMLVDDLRRKEFGKVAFVVRVTRFYGRMATAPRPVRQDIPFHQLRMCPSPSQEHEGLVRNARA